MGPVSLAFLTSSAAVVILYLWARKSVGIQMSRHFRMALMLLATCILTNVVYFAFGSDGCDRVNPVMDVAAGLAAGLTYRFKRERWSAALATSYLVQVSLHVAHATLSLWGEPSARGDVRYLYDLSLNVTFGLQLLIVSLSGGGHALARCLDLVAPGPRGRTVRYSPAGRAKARARAAATQASRGLTTRHTGTRGL